MQLRPGALLRLTDDHGNPLLLPTAVVADLCRVSRRTVQRWQQTGKIPPPALALLHLYAAGRILPRAWVRLGFRVTPCGDLAPPAGRPYSPGELQGYSITLARLALLRARLGEFDQQPLDLAPGQPREGAKKPARARADSQGGEGAA